MVDWQFLHLHDAGKVDLEGEPAIPTDEQVTSVVVTPDLDAEEEASSSCEKMTVPEDGQG